MEKKEELLERLVNEFAAQNKLIVLLIAKNNVETFGKSGIEIVEEMEKESVAIIKWSYNYPIEKFPLYEPEKTKFFFENKELTE